MGAANGKLWKSIAEKQTKLQNFKAKIQKKKKHFFCYFIVLSKKYSLSLL